MSTASSDWSLYDRADMADAVSSAGGGQRRETLISLDGMHCSACVARIERLLRDDTRDLHINLTARTADFSWDASRTRLSDLLARLDQAGFVPRVLAQDHALESERRDRRAALARIGVSLICAMQVMMLAWPSYFADAAPDATLEQILRWSQWLLATPAVLYGGWPFFAGAWRALASRRIDMDVPVALALGIAYGASAVRTLTGAGEIWFDSASMFVLLLAGGRYLEQRTRAIAGERLRRLAGARPLTARRMAADAVEEVPSSSLLAGDVVEVLSGEALPADGELLQAAELDESLLTGEALPVIRAAGASALAGSIHVGNAPLRLRVSRAGNGTELSQITRLLQRAQSERPQAQQRIDRLAGAFILAIIACAVLGALLALPRGTDAAISIALAVLVASCPCALSLALPAARAAASAQLARRGVLLARPAVLPLLPRIGVVLFDKTGTLTRSELSLQHSLPLALAGKQECLRIAAALERGSNHPIARAFAGIGDAPLASDIEQQPGRGLSGTVDGQRYWLGAPDAATLTLDPSWLVNHRGDGLSWIVLCRGQQPLCLFGLGAPPRAEAAEVVQTLQAHGIRAEMLTGDAPDAARSLAQNLGIQSWRARQTPQDKLARVRELQAQGLAVLAVGDGINDAPYLAGADVSVAMPSGAALAQSRADVILVGDSLAGLPALLLTAGRAVSIGRQNLGWALVYNLAVIPAAMAGALPPALAALGMSLSSLLVTANALRLLRTPKAEGAPR